jgi:type I site-specific restriction endonuclease
MKINEATSTDLKVIDALQNKYGWKPEDTLLYQQSYALTPEQQKTFPGIKSIKPDIVLTDLNHLPLAVFENKLDDEKKALTKLRTLYNQILHPRFLYACSAERILFYDTAWKGLEAGEFRRVNGFMTLEEMKLKLEQEKKRDQEKDIVIDRTIAGGYDPAAGKDRYFQIECIQTLIEKFRAGKQKMLVHMATGLGKTRTAVALVKALLDYGLAQRALFVVDRVLLAEQALDDGFSLISNDHPSARLRTSNYRQQKNVKIHVVVIDTLENIFQDIPSTFYDLIIVDECHRSININRRIIFDHFLCPRIGLTATPRTAIAAKGANVSEDDLAILDTYKLFGCEIGEPDYAFNLERGIEEGFLAPYKPYEILTHLTKVAEEKGVEFSYVFDPDERRKIELGRTKNVNLEQLEKKFLSEERAKRIAEEVRKHTEYGEKMILFAASQAHAMMLVEELNREFGGSEGSPRYAEAIISENGELNKTFKTWFKRPYRNPHIAVSVDIMSTGVDIPCVRYIAFAALTQSVGKYIQMLGRGTRLDPKTGKFSFKVLDFVGLCKRMDDNGKGSPKPNVKMVEGEGKGAAAGVGGEGTGNGWFIIDNPDPAKLIQRVWIHGDTVQVKDNIPIDEARRIFEQEAQTTTERPIVVLKEKISREPDYTPTDDEIDAIRHWSKNPEIYLDETQLQAIYDFPQGTMWDFFLNAVGIRKIPSRRERIERGIESYLQTYDFNDSQIKTLRRLKEIFAANVEARKEITTDDIFANPIYERIVGSRDEIERKFSGRFSEVVRDIETVIRN